VTLSDCEQVWPATEQALELDLQRVQLLLSLDRTRKASQDDTPALHGAGSVRHSRPMHRSLAGQILDLRRTAASSINIITNSWQNPHASYSNSSN
jgi:hypothetical protein